MKTCLITGTTNGIGLATARSLAEAGLNVVMATRNLPQASLVGDRLKKTTGNNNVSIISCDLSSLDSVWLCAQTFLETHDRLDLLINNAGMMTGNRELSTEGIELTFATNYLGPYLLTRLLMGTLKQSNDGRIVNVTSNIHKMVRNLPLEDLTGGNRYGGMLAYARSKLANVMSTFSLASLLAGTSVTANCLHPGIVASNLLPENTPLLRFAGKLVRRVMWNAERGSQTSIHLALSEELKGVSGKYFGANTREAVPSALARDHKAQQELWRFSERLLSNHSGFAWETDLYRTETSR
ncbi:MAG: SDR family oxidoreductase [Gammaproteobacteria bacterium]|nr:SDR family oxidoreductase [Gammaproteobacteria bacterium]